MENRLDVDETLEILDGARLIFSPTVATIEKKEYMHQKRREDRQFERNDWREDNAWS